MIFIIERDGEYAGAMRIDERGTVVLLGEKLGGRDGSLPAVKSRHDLAEFELAIRTKFEEQARKLSADLFGRSEPT